MYTIKFVQFNFLHTNVPFDDAISKWWVNNNSISWLFITLGRIVAVSRSDDINWKWNNITPQATPKNNLRGSKSSNRNWQVPFSEQWIIVKYQSANEMRIVLIAEQQSVASTRSGDALYSSLFRNLFGIYSVMIGACLHRTLFAICLAIRFSVFCFWIWLCIGV